MGSEASVLVTSKGFKKKPSKFCRVGFLFLYYDYNDTLKNNQSDFQEGRGALCEEGWLWQVRFEGKGS